ncbi:hypothetical protein B0H19DRAFT_1078137 [Mycena capillaripes]|nr:hypothetical protein B0H19DRAFT_1078137 [Mycena capillaripes]
MPSKGTEMSRSGTGPQYRGILEYATLTARTLAGIASSDSVPFLEPIANLSLLICDDLTLQSNAVNNSIWLRLVELIHNIECTIIAMCLAHDYTIPVAILTTIGEFAQTLQKIYGCLRSQDDLGRIRRFFMKGEINAQLQNCQIGLQEALATLQLKHSGTMVAIESDARGRHQEILTLLEEKSSQSSVSVIQSIGNRSSIADQTSPLRSPRFHIYASLYAIEIQGLISPTSPDIVQKIINLRQRSKSLDWQHGLLLADVALANCMLAQNGLRLHLKCFEAARQTQNVQIMFKCLETLGDSAHLDSSVRDPFGWPIVYFTLARRDKHLGHTYRSLQFIADAFLQSGDIATASATFHAVLNGSKTMFDCRTADCMSRIGDILAAQGNTAEAQKYWISVSDALERFSWQIQVLSQPDIIKPSFIPANPSPGKARDHNGPFTSLRILGKQNSAILTELLGAGTDIDTCQAGYTRLRWGNWLDCGSFPVLQCVNIEMLDILVLPTCRGANFHWGGLADKTVCTDIRSINVSERNSARQQCGGPSYDPDHITIHKSGYLNKSSGNGLLLSIPSAKVTGCEPATVMTDRQIQIFYNAEIAHESQPTPGSGHGGALNPVWEQAIVTRKVRIAPVRTQFPEYSTRTTAAQDLDCCQHYQHHVEKWSGRLHAIIILLEPTRAALRITIADQCL